ncbi:hypothetical protein R5R35_012865 [Gryllus longicercus]|uniref:Ionotropic receptor n=1 Tax=Gryllus longicercus TaxID=2509291 RepID=A0AAN9Z9M4_9ORTH
MAARGAALLLLLCVCVAHANAHPLAPAAQSLLNELAAVLTQLTQRARSLLIVDVGKPDEVSQILHAAAHRLQVAVWRLENATTSLGNCVGVVSAPSWRALSIWLKRQQAPLTSPSGTAHWLMYAPKALSFGQILSLFDKTQNVFFDRGTGILQWDKKSIFMLFVQYENVVLTRPAIHGWPSEPTMESKKRTFIAPKSLQNLIAGKKAFRGSNKRPLLMELAIELRWQGKFVSNITEENFLKEGGDILISPWDAPASPRLEVVREPLNELVALTVAPRPPPAPLVALVRRALARGPCACLAAVVACAWGARVLWGRCLVRRSVAGGVTLLGAMVLAGMVHSLLARVLGGRARGDVVRSPGGFLAADPALYEVLAAAPDQRARQLGQRVLPAAGSGRPEDSLPMTGDCGWLVPIEMASWLKDQPVVVLGAVRAPAFALAVRRGSPLAAAAARAARRLGEGGLLGSARRALPLLRRLGPSPSNSPARAAPLRRRDVAAPLYLLAAAAALALLALACERAGRGAWRREGAGAAASKRKRSVTSTVLKRWRMLSVANLRAE